MKQILAIILSLILVTSGAIPAFAQETELPKLELLVVGHHGSSDATSMQLLHATEPTTAVICVGRRNFYGHPNEQVLERLRLLGVRVYRTDQQGTIVFRG